MPKLPDAMLPLRVVTCLLTLACVLVAQTQQGFSYRRFQQLQPLDAEYLELSPAGERVTLFATLDAPEIAGWELREGNGQKYLRNAQGKIVKYYPEKVRFRVTAGSRMGLEDRKPLPLDVAQSADELKRTLRFRLKRFHELEAKIVEPTEQKMIGVPASVPYDERIYWIEFKLDKVPLEDRFVLEAIDAEGNRVARFGFFLL